MAFSYQDGRLHVGAFPAALDLSSICDLCRAAGRPAYVYDLDNIQKRGEALKSAFSFAELTTGPARKKLSVHYALKANNHPAVLATIRELGFGADTVSAGEIRLALEAGIPANRIIFSGVGKTVREIEFAIQNRIKQINIESPQELTRVIEIARRSGALVDVAFRMNPDVNPDTHPYITTGFRENKFGMDESFLPELKALLRDSRDAVRLRGLTMHIGSQLLDLQSLRDALEKILLVHANFIEDGFTLDRLDIGGGVGIRYDSDDESSEFAMLKAYGAMVDEVLRRPTSVPVAASLETVEILLEPGRILVARAGLLLTEVQYIKKAPAKTFAIVNTGMHHLLRPALYGAKHRVLSIVHEPAASATTEPYDIVGPICESSDVLAKDVHLPALRQGDFVGLADSGAYGFTMASAYNAHELPLQIAVKQGQIVDANLSSDLRP